MTNHRMINKRTVESNDCEQIDLFAGVSLVGTIRRECNGMWYLRARNEHIVDSDIDQNILVEWFKTGTYDKVLSEGDYKPEERY